MNFCPHCHSGHDPVLSQLIWSCGNTMNDPQFRTKECYKRELNAANQRIKRLEDAGDDMASWLINPRNLGDDTLLAFKWRRAKGAKL